MDVEHRVRTMALAGAALCTMTAIGQADELSALKAELAALENRIAELEATAPRAAAVPEGAGLITYYRGTDTASDWTVDRAGESIPTARGFTIAVTPSADFPVPVHEVTISGYVKGDFIYDFKRDVGDYFAYSDLDFRRHHRHLRLHARQSRFRIQSKSDTEIGQIRTLIEGDFFSGGAYGNTDFRLRHAWGEWDMTPNWTFGAGQTWRNFMSLITGITTVDFFGPAGLIGTSRVGQVRLTYRDGPHVFAISAEDPTGEGDWLNGFGHNDVMADFAARWQYDAAGGHKFLVSGATRYFETTRRRGAIRSDDALGWVIQGAATINLADYATFSTSVIYGNGAGNYIAGNGPAYWVHQDTGHISLISALGLFAGVGVPLTETTSFNFGWGMVVADREDIKGGILRGGVGSGEIVREVMSFHGNIIWKPVNELHLGWEIIYGEREYHHIADAGRIRRDDNVRGQFGAWFFF
ncbi:carbohydrate porin [Rhodoligotrophos defluvii]|uniref:carbohydrate porin n=1 Tax=Rhodoligotrophos defluvii TaxID=2561934 RepID=UPI0010C94F02|nr:carbohydrate porin [Rhodoligotrophos defluvii]